MPLYPPVPSELPRFVGNKVITGTLAIGGGSSALASVFGADPTSGVWFTGSSVKFLCGAGVQFVVSAGSLFGGSGGSNQVPIGPSQDCQWARTNPGSITLGGTGNGQLLGLKTLTENTTIAAAATSTTAIQIPAGAIVLAVSTRVTVIGSVSWPATFQVGDGVTAAKFNEGASVSTALNTTDKGTKAGPTYYAAATSIVITPSGTPGDAVGRIRTTIMYVDVTAPTS